MNAFTAKTLKEELEESSKGHYVAIDVLTGNHFMGKFAENALMDAREKSPYGVFHLIRIGGPVSLGWRSTGQPEANWDWTL